MRRFIFLFVLSVIAPYSLSSQHIHRQVVSTFGKSSAAGTGERLSATAGQPIAGTLANGENYLRQGFQQPVRCVTAPDAVFRFDTLGDANCGGPYALVYLDDPRPNTEWSWDLGRHAQPVTATTELVHDLTYRSPGDKVIKLQVTTGNCVETGELTVAIPAAPLATNANIIDLLCLEDEDGAISLISEGGTQPYHIEWENGEAGEVISGLLPGDYVMTLTDANNCVHRDTFYIDGPDSLKVEAILQQESCYDASNGQIELEAEGGTAPYRFDWGALGSSDGRLFNLTAGDYAVTITDNNNCELREIISLTRQCDQLTFYDIITPNGDGDNDTWIVEQLLDYFPAAELSIYDRWGQVVYHSRAYTNDWDGVADDGTALPFGAYYYLLRLHDPGDTSYTGAITVLR